MRRSQRVERVAARARMSRASAARTVAEIFDGATGAGSQALHR